MRKACTRGKDGVQGSVGVVSESRGSVCKGMRAPAMDGPAWHAQAFTVLSWGH